MPLDANLDHPAFGRAFRMGYGVGLALCVAWPLILQLMLGTAIRPPAAAPPDGVVRDLGYTFTGLTFAAAFFVTWRWGRLRKTFAGVEADRKPGLMVREIILYAALFELSALYGLLYYAMGGPSAERFSRSFIALVTIMFFVFVPRYHAWREAAGEESS